MSLGGCDLLGREDTTIVATGRVVLAETGAPIQGLGVALEYGAGYFLAAATRTAPDGTFRIEYDPGEDDRSVHALKINDEPYDGRYTVERTSFVRGERRDICTVALSPNPNP